MPSIDLPANPPGDGCLPAGARIARLEAIDGMDRGEKITAAELHERYLEDVFRYVLRRVPRLVEAQDITAEVFAAAFVALPRFRGHCPPYLWLLSIARRKIIDARRRRAARPEVLTSELADEAGGTDPLWTALAAVEGPEAALMRAEARRVLRDLLAELNADQREALLLHAMERLSVAEAAVVMGRSPASVKSLLQRARATLRRRGQAYFLDDEEHGR
jgi:RNA polymerase sigma-70 factor, ECF subfamily